MKLALGTVLSFGIVGKCVLTAAFGGRRPKAPRTPGTAAVSEKPGQEGALALAAVRVSPWSSECHPGMEGGLQLPHCRCKEEGCSAPTTAEENAWDRLCSPAVTG